MKEVIKKFLHSNEDVLKFDSMIPIQEVDLIMQEMGYNELDLEGDEINGWQVDFWYTWNKRQEYSYTLSGSLFYGDFKLTKNS